MSLRVMSSYIWRHTCQSECTCSYFRRHTCLSDICFPILGVTRVSPSICFLLLGVTRVTPSICFLISGGTRVTPSVGFPISGGTSLAHTHPIARTRFAPDRKKCTQPIAHTRVHTRLHTCVRTQLCAHTIGKSGPHQMTQWLCSCAQLSLETLVFDEANYIHTDKKKHVN